MINNVTMKIYLLMLGLLLCVGVKAQVVRDDLIVLKTDISGKTLAQILDMIEQQTLIPLYMTRR